MMNTNCPNCPTVQTVRFGILEAFSLRFPLPGLSYHVGHHAQLFGCSMDEEVFMSQGQHRSKR